MQKLLIMICVFFCLSNSCSAADLPVTSPFGWRSDPVTGEWKFHAGVDLGYDYGAGIPALFDGVVISAGNNDDGYGNCVLLYHPAIDAYTRYGHCSALYVAVGDNVVAGQLIAAVGSTGKSTGPHLHLEYIVDTPDGYQYTNPLVLWG
jgi:Membrane proteins related to metalloendopeptidases